MCPSEYLNPEIDDQQLADAMTAYTNWRFSSDKYVVSLLSQDYRAVQAAWSHLLTFPRHVTAKAMKLCNQKEEY